MGGLRIPTTRAIGLLLQMAVSPHFFARTSGGFDLDERPVIASTLRALNANAHSAVEVPQLRRGFPAKKPLKPAYGSRRPIVTVDCLNDLHQHIVNQRKYAPKATKGHLGWTTFF
jgi:hypothetical protein